MSRLGALEANLEPSGRVDTALETLVIALSAQMTTPIRARSYHLAAQTGASTRELMQRMGHSTVRAAMIYQHATDARSRDLADRLDALVAERRGASE